MSLIRQVIIILVIAGVAAGGYYGWQYYEAANAPKSAKAGGKPGGGKGGGVSVEVAAATMRKIDTIAEAVGTTRAVRSVEITPLSSGRIVKVGFKAGEPVEPNAILLQLDSDIQRADLAEAEAKLKEADSALKRSAILKRSSNVSEAAFDRLVAQAEIAKADRDRAAKHLRERIVRAPFAGVIGLTTVEPGARVKDGDVIAVLDDLSSVEVEFSAPETLFGTLKIGDEVQARAAPFPGRVFTGTIAAVDTRIDDISRAFKVRGLIANEDKALPAGMFVHVSIVLDGTDALAIPEEAVVVDGSRSFVFAVVSGKDGKSKRVQQRQVSLGRRSYGFVEVKSGIAAGEEVVIRGVQKVRDGAPVQIAGQGKKSGKPADKPAEDPANGPAKTSADEPGEKPKKKPETAQNTG